MRRAPSKSSCRRTSTAERCASAREKTFASTRLLRARSTLRSKSMASRHVWPILATIAARFTASSTPRPSRPSSSFNAIATLKLPGRPTKRLHRRCRTSTRDRSESMMSLDAPDRARVKLRENVLSHLWKRYPQHCVIQTDPRSRRAIDVGIDRAATHGFHAPAQVRAFVTLMLMLGSHFDEDPQLPWAGDYLHRRKNASRAEVMAGLLAEAKERLEPVIGRNGEYYRRSLAWIEARSFDTLVMTYDDTDDGLRTLLRRLHGRKYQVIGEDSVATLIRAARISARKNGLITRPGVVVYLTLMFLLGSAIYRDPFHPWLNATLAAEAERHPSDLARELHTKGIDI